MARSLTEIYNEAKTCRERYLELNECNNDSKMSIMDAFTWVTSACIWSFETILDVFKTDIVNDLQKRTLGTPTYYANALLKYQHGDSLVPNEEGTSFAYSTINEDKRVIKKVSYSEEAEEGFYDKRLVLKVAKGSPGQYNKLDVLELNGARAYIRQISFAGTHATVVSRNGDVLIPKLTVYYSSSADLDKVRADIESALNEFVAGLDFNGVVYAQKVIDAIQTVQNVTDVYIDPTAEIEQGVFIAQYNDDDVLIPVAGSTDNYEHKIERYFVPSSGFLKQSSGAGEEEGLPRWSECIVLKPENNEVLY